MVSTMELYSLGRILELEPELRRGWTYPKVTKDWTSKRWAKPPMLAALVAMRQRLPGLAAEKLPKFGVEAMWVYHPLVSARLARICKLAGVELIAWTVDDLPRMRKLVDDGRRRPLLQRPPPLALELDSTCPDPRCDRAQVMRTRRSDGAGRRRRRRVAAALLDLHRRLELLGGEAADRLAVERVAVEGDAEDAAERAARSASRSPGRSRRSRPAGRRRRRPRTRSATPATISSAAGSTPSRKTAPPIAMLPVICWPQRWRKIEAERFSVSNGPVPSIAITGTARKVTSDQAMPTRRAAIWPTIPPWFSSSAHHQADRGRDRRPAADLA